ncbi:PLP-dependent transferase [Clavulina sp. PMI_390]|nr:PLP-dependent transferase [Clavulina sp. PMI_390]
MSKFSFWTNPATQEASSKNVRLTRASTNPESHFDLTSVMSYGPNRGLPQLVEYIRAFVGEVHQPCRPDWDVMVTLGSSDALAKVLDVLTEPGDACLVEAFSYSYALAQFRGVGIRPVGLRMDAGGLDPADLEHILATWDVKETGSPRPRLLFTIPVGQNPTGTLLTSERKQAIYDICAKWDVLIIEDDPYYFGQFGAYIPPYARDKSPQPEITDKEWLNSLIPSFLHYDNQGRVIRLDTFSKVLGPGARLGFVTAPKNLIQHIENAQNETTTAPSGISQAVIGSMLLQWGVEGFVRWLRGMSGVYRMRRDWVVDLFLDKFHVQEEIDDAGHLVYISHAKPASAEATNGADANIKVYTGSPNEPNNNHMELVRFIPSSSGMFLWLQVSHLFKRAWSSFLIMTMHKYPTESTYLSFTRLWLAFVDLDSSIFHGILDLTIW